MRLSRSEAAYDHDVSMGDRSGRIDRDGPASVWSQVAADLEADIASGALKPGARLPAEPELAEVYGVSRITVRPCGARPRGTWPGSRLPWARDVRHRPGRRIGTPRCPIVAAASFSGAGLETRYMKKPRRGPGHTLETGRHTSEHGQAGASGHPSGGGGKTWRVTRGKKYWKLWCPNPCKCRKTVHLTPSDPRYTMNLRHWLSRETCWDGERRAER